MAGFNNEVVYGTNVDFTGNALVTPQMVADGSLLIGSTASPNIKVGNIISSDNYIAVNNQSGQIDLTQGSAGADVIGPASSTDNAIVRWDGLTGKLIKNSLAILDDTGNLSGLGTVGATGDVTVRRSASGSSVITQTTNSDNTSTSSNAVNLISVGGTAGGDPVVQFVVTGGRTWTVGADNTVDDGFTIAKSSALGTTNVFNIEGTSNQGNFLGSFVIETSSAFEAIRSTGAGNNSTLEIQVLNDTGGDPRVRYHINGTGAIWTHGFDNTDSNTFKLAQSSTVETNTRWSVTTGGTVKNEAGSAYNVTSTAVSYNVLTTDYIIAVTDNSAARTISLPAAPTTGQVFVIKDAAGTAGSANAITVDTVGAELIDGAASTTINANYGSITVYFNGTNYFII